MSFVNRRSDVASISVGAEQTRDESATTARWFPNLLHQHPNGVTIWTIQDQISSIVELQDDRTDWLLRYLEGGWRLLIDESYRQFHLMQNTLSTQRSALLVDVFMSYILCWIVAILCLKTLCPVWISLVLGPISTAAGRLDREVSVAIICSILSAGVVNILIVNFGLH